MNYKFLQQGETIIIEGSANKMQFLGINKGGQLILTNRRLIFKAHALNFGSKFDEIPLSEITRTDKKLNIFCPTPNMIKICTLNGKTYQFVVTGKLKDLWLQKFS